MPRRDGLSPVPVHPIDALLVGSPDAVRVPLIGQALCAGFPSPADDFLEGAPELPRWLVPNPPATFLWRISGSSMEGAGIYDRELAPLSHSPRASARWTGHGPMMAALDAYNARWGRGRMVPARAELESRR